MTNHHQAIVDATQDLWASLTPLRLSYIKTHNSLSNVPYYDNINCELLIICQVEVYGQIDSEFREAYNALPLEDGSQIYDYAKHDESSPFFKDMNLWHTAYHLTGAYEAYDVPFQVMMAKAREINLYSYKHNASINAQGYWASFLPSFMLSHWKDVCWLREGQSIDVLSFANDIHLPSWSRLYPTDYNQVIPNHMKGIPAYQLANFMAEGSYL